MAFKIFASMNIAIIGCGEISEGYAAAFALAGHNVSLAAKNGVRLCLSPALSAFDNIQVSSIEAAADQADLIIIMTPATDVREVAYWLGDVRNKVIIDATSNIHAPGEETVRTALAIGAITGAQHIVTVFHAKGYEQLLKPLFRDNKIDMILAGDSKKAKEVTKILARELGINYCYDFGGSDTLPLFTEMTRLWRTLVTKNTPHTLIATLP